MTPDGRKVEATSGVSADPSEWRRGRRLVVVFEPGNPANVRPAASVAAGPGLTPWVLGLFAFICFALSSAFVLPARSPRKVH